MTIDVIDCGVIIPRRDVPPDDIGSPLFVWEMSWRLQKRRLQRTKKATRS